MGVTIGGIYMYDYGNEINELVNDGWDYDDAVAWMGFIMGENE